MFFIYFTNDNLSNLGGRHGEVPVTVGVLCIGLEKADWSSSRRELSFELIVGQAQNKY